MYKDSLSKLKNISSENNSNTNILQGNISQLNSMNNANSSMNVNRMNVPINNNNLNNSYYTYNPPRNINDINQTNERDESFRYSYFLIDNLKNAINSVDFKKDYSNL